MLTTRSYTVEVTRFWTILLLTGLANAAAAQQLRIVNLGPQFKEFWSLANGKSFDEQLRIWDQKVEQPNHRFYDAMVWGKAENPKWPERRQKRLKALFAKYPTLYPQIVQGFDAFDKTLNEQIARFKKAFPDAQFDSPVYAAPGTTFNGRSAEAGEVIDGHPVLAFGIDTIVDRKDDPNVLYSHELFHMYHTPLIGNEKDLKNNGKLTLPLWLEGFATYVSYKLNPKAKMDAVFMDDRLPQVPKKEISWLAKSFLAESGQKAFDEKHLEIYGKWFMISDDAPLLRPDLPKRCGYLLGFEVVRLLAKSHSVSEMAHWKLDEMHRQVLGALKQLSENQ